MWGEGWPIEASVAHTLQGFKKSGEDPDLLQITLVWWLLNIWGAIPYTTILKTIYTIAWYVNKNAKGHWSLLLKVRCLSKSESMTVTFVKSVWTVIYSNCFHHAPICKLWKRKRSAERDMKETTTLQSCYCFIIIINPLKHSFHTCTIKILISFLLIHTASVFQQKPVSLVRFTKTIRNGKRQITCFLWNFREIQQFQQALFTNEHKYCCWLIHARVCLTQTTTRS